MEEMENNMKALTDELQDVKAERTVFREKAERLNMELNHILGNHEARIIDVDALCMENKWVRDVPDRSVIIWHFLKYIFQSQYYLLKHQNYLIPNFEFT